MDRELLYNPEERYEQLVREDNTDRADSQRMAALYVLAGNIQLYKNVDAFYDFEAHEIKADTKVMELEVPEMAQKMLKLAMNLYDAKNKADVAEVFFGLDQNNTRIAKKAISIRFSN